MKKNSICILLGLPGSGKGTLSSYYITKYPSIGHLSLGDLFRKEIANATPIGAILADYQAKGKLAPAEFTSNFVITKLDEFWETNDHLILDGFPRTIEQAKMLENYLQEKNIAVNVIFLDVDNHTAINRIKHREICDSCAKTFNKLFRPAKIAGICDDCSGVLQKRVSDQDEIKIKERVEFLHSELANLINFYHNNLNIINANLSFDSMITKTSNIHLPLLFRESN